jgi:sugar phosphate permease
MNENPTEKVLTYRWLVLGIMALAFAFVYFHRLCPAVVAVDLQKTFGASGSVMGLLASAYFYPYAVMQFPAGLLSDSIGPRKTVTVFLTIAGVGSLLFGFASGIGTAIAARIMVGVGVSMVFIPAMKVFSQWFRISEFAFVTAILNVMGGVGALSAATPLAFIAGWLGWRAGFEIIGLGTLIMAVLVWILVRNRPQDKGWPSISEIDYGGAANGTPLVGLSLWQGARTVITEKYFWPLAVWFFFDCGIFFGFGALWAGPYLMQVYGLRRAEVGSILNMIAVALIVASPIISALSDKVLYSRKKVMMITSAILVGEFLLLSIFPSGLSKLSLYLAIFIMAACSAAIVVIAFTTAKELFPVEIAGTSTGTVNLFPFLGGGLFQPGIGWILDGYPTAAAGEYSIEGYRVMLMVLLAAAILCLICTFMMKETFPGSRMRKGV